MAARWDEKREEANGLAGKGRPVAWRRVGTEGQRRRRDALRQPRPGQRLPESELGLAPRPNPCLPNDSLTLLPLAEYAPPHCSESDTT